MATSSNVFERVEKKYLLSLEQFAAFKKTISRSMKADDYGYHTISNLYYDTENYALIRESLERPVYKEKLRERAYGKVSEDSMVFVEIKKKFKGVVYKRRAGMNLREADLFLASGMMRTPMEQIHKEIAYFLQIHPVYPRVYLAYDRVAMFDPAGSDLRITFDRNIRFRTEDLSLAAPDHGTLILPETEVLMELKFPGAMPMQLSRTLSELEIFPVSYSKYGRCYQDYLYKDLLKGGTRHVA